MSNWSIEDDVNRLRDISRKHGFMIRSCDIKKVWENYSKSSRTSWLALPELDSELIEQLLEPLHEWLATEETTPLPSRDVTEPSHRAPLIDEQDGPCEICASWRSKNRRVNEEGKNICLCDECNKDIPIYPSMGGRGIMGVVPHHYHLRLINGSEPGRAGIHQELCLECAIALRLKVYPPDNKDKFGNFNPTSEQMFSYKG